MKANLQKETANFVWNLGYSSKEIAVNSILRAYLVTILRNFTLAFRPSAIPFFLKCRNQSCYSSRNTYSREVLKLFDRKFRQEYEKSSCFGQSSKLFQKSRRMNECADIFLQRVFHKICECKMAVLRPLLIIFCQLHEYLSQN